MDTCLIIIHHYHLSVYINFFFYLINYKRDMKHAENDEKGEEEFPKTSVKEI